MPKCRECKGTKVDIILRSGTWTPILCPKCGGTGKDAERHYQYKDSYKRIAKIRKAKDESIDSKN